MIEIKETEIYGWEAAIRGMRNPMESWDKSDSDWCSKSGLSECTACVYMKCGVCCAPNTLDVFRIGPEDLTLMRKLVKAGPDHAKFMRMIDVTCDITAPLYWWKEFDTYKVGTVANSCSTMHKIHAKEFAPDDFSWDKLLYSGCPILEYETCNGIFSHTLQPQSLLIDLIIPALNLFRSKFIETGDKIYWWQMIQLLPSSYNQRRTVQLNYAVLRNIYSQRKAHKLDEWRDFCSWAESLPYGNELIVTGE